MKAAIWTDYGPPEVLQLRDVETPTPKENEFRIKIHASTVTAGDCEMRSLKFPFYLSLPMRFYAGFPKPTRVKIIGQELAGEIDAVGEAVTRFRVGDQVFAALGFGHGAYAEYICLLEDSEDDVVVPKPANMTFEEAAAVPVGGLEALHFLRLAKIKPGQRVLINGAGGSIGTFGIQLARYYGAEVIAVDRSSKLELLRSLGANSVMDYTQEDFTKKGKTYDVIFDVVGKSSFTDSIQALNEGGYYLIANPGLSYILRGLLASGRSTKKVVVNVASHKSEDLLFLKERIETGELESVIDRRYPLEEIADAHRYVESGEKKGNVVIIVNH